MRWPASRAASAHSRRVRKLPRDRASALGSHRRRRERQQRDVSRALDRRRQLALMPRAVAGDPARNQLAALGDEAAEQPDVFVIDRNSLGTEAAHLAPLHAAAKRHLSFPGLPPPFPPPPRPPPLPYFLKSSLKQSLAIV